jgi:hypothetical protein
VAVGSVGCLFGVHLGQVAELPTRLGQWLHQEIHAAIVTTPGGGFIGQMDYSPASSAKI